MKFNRAIFFKCFREKFGQLSAEKVQAIEHLLIGFETYDGWWDNIDQIGNAMAQTALETAHSFQPCVEAYYLGDPNKPGFYQGNTERVARVQRSFRYYPDFGRGYIQLTWAENYHDQDMYVRKYFPERVTDFEHRTGQTFSLIKHPEQALDPWISFCILTVGMHKGTFRGGHSLDRYINSRMVDHFNARDIINGDKNYRMKGSGVKVGVAMAAEAVKLTDCLRKSLISGGSPVVIDRDPVAENSQPGESAIPTAGFTPGDQAPPAEELRQSGETPHDESGSVPPAGDGNLDPAQQSGKENIVIEKHERVKLWDYIKAKFAVLTGGNVSFSLIMDQVQQVSAFGLTPEMVSWFIRLALGASIVALVILVYTWWKEEKEKKARTTQLVEENSNPNNIMHFASTAELQEWKDWGAIVVRR